MTVVRGMWCIYCNVGKVFCELINNVIKSFVITANDSQHAAIAYLFCEIIMVRDNFLTSLPGWFTRDDINDIIFSMCHMNSVCIDFIFLSV